MSHDTGVIRLTTADAAAAPLDGSDKPVPLDHNEVFGPLQPANLVVIADRFTERAGGRPHTDVRLANLFDPCLVKLRLTGAVGRDVENPVTDRGSDPARVSHACSRIRYAAGRASRSVSSWMPTAIFVRADECCRL
jgi:hypothetical protein